MVAHNFTDQWALPTAVKEGRFCMQAKFNIFHLLLNKDKAIRIVQLKVIFSRASHLCCADNAVIRL